MIKDSYEALRDGFTHVTEITDPALLKALRSEGVHVDGEGYWRKFLGDYEIRFEPLQEEDVFLLAIYKNGVVLVPKIKVWLQKLPNQ